MDLTKSNSVGQRHRWFQLFQRILSVFCEHMILLTRRRHLSRVQIIRSKSLRDEKLLVRLVMNCDIRCVILWESYYHQSRSWWDMMRWWKHELVQTRRTTADLETLPKLYPARAFLVEGIAEYSNLACRTIIYPEKCSFVVFKGKRTMPSVEVQPP